MTQFSFVEALTPQGSKSSMAQEIAIHAKFDLEAMITKCKSDVAKLEALRKITVAKAEREAAGHFKKTLGNLKNFSIEGVIDSYKEFKNSASADAEIQSEISTITEEINLLEEILAMFPTDVAEIDIEEKA